MIIPQTDPTAQCPAVSCHREKRQQDAPAWLERSSNGSLTSGDSSVGTWRHGFAQRRVKLLMADLAQVARYEGVRGETGQVNSDGTW
jgi:hypothetical protein